MLDRGDPATRAQCEFWGILIDEVVFPIRGCSGVEDIDTVAAAVRFRALPELEVLVELLIDLAGDGLEVNRR